MYIVYYCGRVSTHFISAIMQQSTLSVHCYSAHKCITHVTFPSSPVSFFQAALLRNVRTLGAIRAAHLQCESRPELDQPHRRPGVDHVTAGADRLRQLHVRGGVVLALRLGHVARPAVRSGQVRSGQRAIPAPSPATAKHFVTFSDFCHV